MSHELYIKNELSVKYKSIKMIETRLEYRKQVAYKKEIITHNNSCVSISKQNFSLKYDKKKG